MCSIDGCGHKAMVRGWCNKHYLRWKRHGTTDDPKLASVRRCSFQGCDRKYYGRGLCKAHYAQKFRRGRELMPVGFKQSDLECGFDGCERKRSARGLCKAHHEQQRVSQKLTPLRQRLADGATRGERFWAKVDRGTGPNSCWLWMGSTVHGYGSFRDDVRTVRAHRFSYELVNGPIPESMQLDHRHTCPKRCVNPSHLRVVTNKENQENLAGARRNSRTGIRGVHWDAAAGKWRCMVGHNNRKYTVGRYDTIEDAEAAAIAKRLELHTHNDADRESV